MFRRRLYSGSMSSVIVTVLAVAPAGAAEWFRDFNDGTFQGIERFDYAEYLTLNIITDFYPEIVDTNPDPAIVENSLRLKFGTKVSSPTSPEDIGLMIDKANLFSDVSVKVLIKFSTNTLFTSSEGRDMTLGVFLRTTLGPRLPDPPKTYAYIVGLSDAGKLGFTKLIPVPDFLDVCPDQTDVPVPDFDPTKDWWMRAEAVDDGQGGVIVRGRAWLNGTPEPEAWLVECTDTGDATYPVWASGGVAIGAQEEGSANDSNGQSFIDVDDVSVTLPPEKSCYNHQDDDSDGLTDCADPDCADAAFCQCADPFADFDRSGSVDQADFGLWQACFSGELNPYRDAYCDCADREDLNGDHLFNPAVDGDGDTDAADLEKFLSCVSGPAMPADTTCDDVLD